MARKKMLMSRGSAISEHLSFGLLASSFPARVVDEVLAETGRQSQRERDLPARVVVYYVIALALFMRVSTQEVLRSLVEGLQWLCGAKPWGMPTTGAISQARSRLGAEPLERLFKRMAQPLAQPGSPGAFYRQWRLVSLDGFSLDLADSASNAEHFGRHQNARGRAAYPQMRCAGLVESGTHAIIGANLGPCHAEERALCTPLLESLQAGMLCLADRGFYGFEFWEKAQAHGAELLWRVQKGVLLPVEEELPDGSYLSRIYPGEKARLARRLGRRVRVIEYRLEGQNAAAAPYRLITTLLDYEQAPAEELAAQYPQRWEIEGCFDELKTHLRGAGAVLRSKSPALVAQEFWGLLLAHWMVRKLIHQVAEAQVLDPDRISFTHTVNIVRRNLASLPGFFPSSSAGHPPSHLP